MHGHHHAPTHVSKGCEALNNHVTFVCNIDPGAVGCAGCLYKIMQRKAPVEICV